MPTSEFRDLHRQPQILRLPNVWDVASAKLFESLGAQAIATTSAGVSWAAGYADGSKLPTSVALGTVKKLSRAVKVPLTIDIEDGYYESPSQVAELVIQLAELGVAGINIEDGKQPVDLLQAKITAIRDRLARRKLDLFINARTDVFLARLVPDADLLGESVARAKRYAEAGADGIFVPGIVDSEQIRSLVSATSLPLNVLAWQGLPDAAHLKQLGVARLSAGSSIAAAVWGHAARLAKEFLETGDSQKIKGQISFEKMQDLFG